MPSDYLTGRTPEQVLLLKLDNDGKPTDAGPAGRLHHRCGPLSGCGGQGLLQCQGAGRGQRRRVSLGVEAVNGSSDVTATDDRDVNAEIDISLVALTLDAEGRVTSAVADMAEPALTVAADGGITAPDKVETKLEQGDRYGMRGASSLNKEWYEHSEGFCGYLKGKTRAEVAAIPADGSDADLDGAVHHLGDRPPKGCAGRDANQITLQSTSQELFPKGKGSFCLRDSHRKHTGKRTHSGIVRKIGLPPCKIVPNAVS